MPGLSVAYETAIGRSDEPEGRPDERRDHGDDEGDHRNDEGDHGDDDADRRNERGDPRREDADRRSERDDGVAAALDATASFDHYDATIQLETEDVVVGQTSYDGYPIRRVETDHGTAFLEGRLYDVETGVDGGADDRDGGAEAATDLDAHLERVAAMIAADDREGLREWVGARDGDFLLAVVDGATVTLCNDAFARLPAYTATIDGTVVCSRELSFVRAFARQRGEPLALDRLGICQFLTFGYYLGTRTPFEGVESVPPGSLVRLQSPGDPAGDPGVQRKSLYEHDFEDCTHADRSVATNAEALADRIETACERRVAPEQPTVVSLSGGLDSRVVAAAYANLGTDVAAAAGSGAAGDSSMGGLPASAATFQRRGDRPDDEVAAAGAVAERLDLDWSVYEIESSPARRRALLDAKQGTNFLGMAYVLDFFEQLRDRRGTATYVTGDGGDKTLVGLEPAKRPASASALVDHVIEANSRLPPAEAAAIANVDTDALRASVADRLRSYPESDRSRRYVHFMIRERGINFLGHGEDRNRYYAWSVSPFYALPVFEYAMNCPDEQKAYRELLGRILERFDPALLDVSYPNYGAPITSRRYRAKQFVYDALERYPAVRDRVVDLVTADGAGATERNAIVDGIRTDLDGLEGTGLSRTGAADVLATPDAHSTIELELLATVAALASDTAGETSDVAAASVVADATSVAGRTGDESAPEGVAGSGGDTIVDSQRARVDR